VGNSNLSTPKRVRLEAKRLAIGQSLVVTSPEIIAHTLGTAYGVPPWEILKTATVEDLMTYWALYCEIQPRSK
jgi:hypothetical protein